MDDQFQNYLTINAHKGLYKFRRLVFGVKVSLGIFLQIMDSMLAGLDGVVSYIDNILIKSASKINQVKLIQQVFQRQHDYGFKVGEHKCHFLWIILNIYISQLTKNEENLIQQGQMLLEKCHSRQIW